MHESTGLEASAGEYYSFRGVCVVICSPVQKPTIGLIEDMPGRNLKHTTRRKDGPFEQRDQTSATARAVLLAVAIGWLRLSRRSRRRGYEAAGCTGPTFAMADFSKTRLGERARRIGSAA